MSEPYSIKNKTGVRLLIWSKIQRDSGEDQAIEIDQAKSLGNKFFQSRKNQKNNRSNNKTELNNIIPAQIDVTLLNQSGS